MPKPLPMLDLPSVSLICLDTRDPDLAVYAMQRCLAQARFGEAILLTKTGYQSPDPRIRAVPVTPIRNIAEYSAFMVRDLGQHFTGSHALVMQWDSFVLDAQAWDPAFLDYDYIGAPWPDRAHPVGNGGFSLRSARLYRALQDERITDFQPEDYCICDLHHDLLVTEHGIRFAPLDMARRFAFELEAPPGPCFGFHGLFNFYRALPDAELVPYLEGLTERALRSMQGRRLLKNLIAQKRRAPAEILLTARARGSFKERIDALKLRLRLALKG